MPLWKLITEPVSLDYIHEKLLESSSDIKDRLFSRVGTNGMDWQRKGSHNQNHFHNFLRRNGTIDALNTVLLLLAEDQFHFSVVHFVSRRACLISTMENVCMFPPFDDEGVIYFLYSSIIKRFFTQLNLPEGLDFIDRYQWPSGHHMPRWIKTRKLLLEYLQDKSMIEDSLTRAQTLKILNKLHELPKEKRRHIYVDMMLYFANNPEYNPNSQSHLALFH